MNYFAYDIGVAAFPSHQNAKTGKENCSAEKGCPVEGACAMKEEGHFHDNGKDATKECHHDNLVS